MSRDIVNSLKIEPIVQPTKTAVLCDKLVEVATRLGPDAQLPSFRDLCRLFKVSKATLDHALHELEERRLIVRKHGSGTYVAPTFGRKSIGVVLGSNIFGVGYSPFWPLLLQAARTQLPARGHQLHCYLDFPQGEELLAAHQQLEEDLRAKRLDGLLLIAGGGPEELQWLQQWQTPLVVLPEMSDATLSPWCVSLASMVPAGVAELARAGCRRLALVSLADAGNRFADSVRGAGLTYAADLDWTAASYQGGWGDFEEFGYRCVRDRWAQLSPPVDGLVITDDTMARGALMALHQAGVAVGHDLQLAVGANVGSPVLRPYESGLILLEFDPAELLRAALTMLDTLLEGGRPRERLVRIQPRARRGGAAET